MKENPSKTHVPPLTATGQRNDFSEQEAAMTASATPPIFALTASAVDGNSGQPNDDEGGNNHPHRAELEELGLGIAEIQAMPPAQAAQLVAVSKHFSPSQWAKMRHVFIAHGLCVKMWEILHDFHEKFEWIMEREAQSLAILPDMPYSTAQGSKTGHVELVKHNGKLGMRAIIPYADFGGNLILCPTQCTAVLGRAVDATQGTEEYAKAMNEPKGTNRFRFHKDFKVGKNEGGGNVLDVANWTWPINNAWLQACVDRPDRMRFVSDPKLPTTLYKFGGTIEDGLTVTGKELGVLMNRGLAPDPDSGEVKDIANIDRSRLPKVWIEIKRKVNDNGDFGNVDWDAHKKFLYGSESPSKVPKQYKSPEGAVLATQTVFFEDEAPQRETKENRELEPIA